ncbi:hypothetical protein NYQ83_06655 [Afifella sp. JA880]|uniref:hypothetical protein n=1 Tax=Afifella sp. JA880 TaxID=2975280 RepID=UPI0021BB31B2|nr:hypothetical protein [Afifella sp. JA880]MCT8266949.1 hypothetical protein [Afifella sp. JA880]
MSQDRLVSKAFVSAACIGLAAFMTIAYSTMGEATMGEAAVDRTSAASVAELSPKTRVARALDTACAHDTWPNITPGCEAGATRIKADRTVPLTHPSDVQLATSLQ